ncbi:putative E3 ubiquitin-protein ligase HIP1 [Gossypium australe]|uniref:Putative E3 ubiquitin-protein ligase HIP1 n=1 Tax=Gossypium australe TaxID=47621 RepID=A0A5B6X3I1_9ROSI|nr:putative E3 ubiquitin-protein ligase HIP1 [Gossypium australe]
MAKGAPHKRKGRERGMHVDELKELKELRPKERGRQAGTWRERDGNKTNREGLVFVGLLPTDRIGMGDGSIKVSDFYPLGLHNNLFGSSYKL